MSNRAIAAVAGINERTVRRDQVRHDAAPDPLAEEKADGRVVKLTGPGSLLHSEPVDPRTRRTGRPRRIDPPTARWDIMSHLRPRSQRAGGTP